MDDICRWIVLNYIYNYIGKWCKVGAMVSWMTGKRPLLRGYDEVVLYLEDILDDGKN